MSEHTIPSVRAGSCTAIMVHHNYHSKSHSSAMKRAQELSRWCKVHIVISKLAKALKRKCLGVYKLVDRVGNLRELHVGPPCDVRAALRAGI